MINIRPNTQYLTHEEVFESLRRKQQSYGDKKNFI